MWAAGGAPVKVIYPADGTTASMEGVAIIKDDPNPAEAKASSISSTPRLCAR